MVHEARDCWQEGTAQVNVSVVYIGRDYKAINRSQLDYHTIGTWAVFEKHQKDHSYGIISAGS